MMNFARVGAFVALALVLCIGLDVAIAHPESAIPNGVIIANAKRTISIKTNIEEQTIEVELQNEGTEALSYFLVAIPPSKAANLAIVDAKQVKNGHKLQTAQVTLPEAEDGAAVFQVQLAAPLKAAAVLRVEVKIAFTHTLTPLPAAIEQADSQFMEYRDHTLVYSPHAVSAQTTVVELASAEIESYQPKADASARGSKITYGPFGAQRAWSLGDKLYVHAENNHPFATIRTLDKEVEVSHWGNIAVTELSLIEHTGAALKGGFSRSAYQSYNEGRMGRNSFRSLVAKIPLHARDLYFRDAIGNISTSSFRRERDTLSVDLQPRYPMFGGWRADLEFGYNLPAAALLARDTADAGQYYLDVPFGAAFPNVAIDELTLRIILPEGATDLRWSTPFDVDAVDFETRLTYLDATGRPVLVVRKRNVAPWHFQKMTVAYKFAATDMAREPLLLFAAVFGFLALVMVAVRIDLSFDGAASASAAPVHEKSE